MDVQQTTTSSFLAETREHLARLESSIDDIEKAEGLEPAILAEILCLTVNVRGAAVAAGLSGLAELAAHLEYALGGAVGLPFENLADVLADARQTLAAIESGGDVEVGSTEPIAAAGNGSPTAPATDDKPSPEGAKLAPAPADAEPGASGAASGATELQTRLLAAFQIEQREHIASIRSLLDRHGNSESPPADDLYEMFRRAHSLKGAARACDLTEISALAHRLEDLYAKVREGALALDAAVVRVVHEVLDALEDGAESSGPSPPSLAAALETIDGLLTGEVRVHAPPPPPSPPAAPQAGRPSPPREDLVVSPTGIDTVRVPAERFDRILDAGGQVITECMLEDSLGDDLKSIFRTATALQDECEHLRQKFRAKVLRSGQNADLAPLVQGLDEATVNARQLAHRARHAERRQRAGSWRLSRLGRHLREEVGRARMTPAESVFPGLRKVVRDVAREEDKLVEIEVSGLEVRADRMVLQTLKDPVMHLVRNAVSHGIETPAERRRAGKPECGRIEVRIEAAGSRLRVSVADDGRGLDRRRVLERALAEEWLSADDAADLSDHALSRLLLRPGLSTRSVVTDISGRGMGLSVVHEAALRLQGDVEVQALEVGTRFLIDVPLAVSTYRVLLVASADQTFALPLSGVVRLLRVGADDLQNVEGRSTIHYDGQLLEVKRLDEILELGLHSASASDRRFLVIVRCGSGLGALVVDRVLGERDALLKSLDEPAARLRHLGGAILLEDGAVALVVQPPELIAAASHKLATVHAPLPAAPKVTQQRRILVVDDSFTTRTLQKSILETHGYEVAVAVDGQEALERLQVHTADLVISDIEMPRLDGFELLQRLKNTEGTASTPVIIVSSRDKHEDRLRGLQLGADAYIVKQRFDHEELLETIRQIVG